MDGMKIDDAVVDTNVTGVERIPVSDGGAPKAVTVESVKDFVLRALAGAASVTPAIASDGFYVIQSGGTKQVTAVELANAIARYTLDKTNAPITDNTVVSCKTGTTVHCCTVGDIVALATSEGINIADLGTAGVLGANDAAIVGQSGVSKRTTLGALRTFIESNLASYLVARSTVQTVGANDLIVFLTGGVIKTVKAQDLMASAGDVSGPDATTENNLPQWDTVNKKLKNGLAVTSQIAAVPEGVKIPTEAAVRNAISVASGVSGPSHPVAGNIPQWGEGQALTNGVGIVEEVAGIVGASDDVVPTEKAVRAAIDNETVKPPLETAENFVPQWGTGNELKKGLALRTDVRTSGQDDLSVPTEKAVRTAIDGFTATIDGVRADINAMKLDDLQPPDDNTDLDATAAKHGLMSKSDKAKLDSLDNENTLDEMTDDLADDDSFVMIDTSVPQKKRSLISKVWAYMAGKLTGYKLDDLGAPDDNTDLNASATAHGLCPKLSGVATQFLDGTGVFSTPTNNTPFEGDSGSGGAQGLVPAPMAGDAADGKFLKANGQWAEPGSAVGVNITEETTIDAVAAGDELYVYDVSLQAYRKATAAQLAAYFAGIVRYDTLWIPAGAITPKNTDGAVAETFSLPNATHDVLRFLHTKDTLADINIVMPDDWDGGAVKVKVYWAPYNADGYADQWVRFKLSGARMGNDEALTGLTGVASDIDDQMIAVNDLHVTGAAEVAVAGAALAGKMVHLILSRDYDFNNGGEGVALSTGACVFGVLVQYKKTMTAEAW